jgi:hypothetical protein
MGDSEKPTARPCWRFVWQNAVSQIFTMNEKTIS